MLPDRNLNGQIEAIQVRLDKVYNQKFYNLTSIDQYYGTQSKCCPHYVGVHEGDEVVCLTEGVMKADIAYSFALGTSYESGFVGLTGVPSYSQFERALEELNSIGVVRINIMVDSDYQVKEEVRKARDRYIGMDTCYTCWLEECLATNCLGCKRGNYPDCKWIDLKKSYQEEDK